MNNNYVVYTEIFNNGNIERWYYGTYDHTTANRVAEALGHSNDTWHCVCTLADAKEMGIKNLP